MFDIAWTELLLVAMIAIIVVGPKELPGMLRAFGKTFGQVRRTAREFQSTFNDALREAEREANLDEVRKGMDSVRSMNPASSIKKSLDETKRAMSETVSDKAPPKPDVVPLKPEKAEKAEPAAQSDETDEAPAPAPKKAAADGR